MDKPPLEIAWCSRTIGFGEVFEACRPYGAPKLSLEEGWNERPRHHSVLCFQYQGGTLPGFRCERSGRTIEKSQCCRFIVVYLYFLAEQYKTWISQQRMLHCRSTGSIRKSQRRSVSGASNQRPGCLVQPPPRHRSKAAHVARSGTFPLKWWINQEKRGLNVGILSFKQTNKWYRGDMQQ